MSHQVTTDAQNPLVYETHAIVTISGSPATTLKVTQPVTVGSADQADIVLKQPTVSRLHAELVPRADGLWVRDLGSRNGTFVAGVRIGDARIPDRAQLTFGDYSIECSYERSAAKRSAQEHESFGEISGRSANLRQCMQLLRQAANSDVSVLISGETGVGKDVAARAIHGASARAQGPFTIVDCGALPEGLLESELFGHTRGSFTGAIATRSGAFEESNGGTIFIDEVGELPLALQPKLLRALEARAVRRIGESAYRKVDVRVIAATHRDLRKMVNEGTFREDLYFRLAVVPIRIPSLRERVEDIEELLTHFLGRSPRQLMSAEEWTTIVSANWPGNVRQLRNFANRVLAVGVERALELSRGDLKLAEVDRSSTDDVDPFDPLPAGDLENLHAYRDRTDRAYITSLLARHGDNMTQAARVAGIARAHLYRLIKRWQL